MNAFFEGVGEDDPRLRQFDELLRNASATIVGEAQHLARERDHRNLFRRLWATCELVARHLCDLCNTAYLPSAVVDDRLENSLRWLTKKKIRGGLASGDYNTSLQLFTGAAEGLGRVEPLLRDVLREPLPPECGAFVSAIKLVKEAREDCGVPLNALFLRTYVQKRPDLAKTTKTALHAFFETVASLRNADTHLKVQGDGGAAAYATRPDQDGNSAWCEVVNLYLGPAVRELLMWEPLRRVLTELQQVEVVGEVPPDRRSPISVEWVLAAQKPPVSRMGGYGAIRWAPKDPRLLARVGESRSVVQCVAPWSSFPCSKQSIEEGRAAYRKAFAARLFDDGVVVGTELEQLGVETAGLKLGEDDTAAVREEVWGVCRAAVAWAEGGATEMPVAVLDVLPVEQRAASIEAVREHLLAFAARQDAAVVDAVDRADIGVLSTRGIADATGLPVDIAKRAMERLQRAGRIAEVAPGRDAWRLPNEALATRLTKVFETAQESAGPDTPDYVWELMDLSVELLRDACPGETRADDLARRLSDLREAKQEVPAELPAAEPGSPAAEGGADAAGPSLLRLEVDGEVLTARGLTGIVRQLGQRGILERRADQVKAALPFIVGRVRYLAHFEPTHSNGSRFSYGVDVVCGGTPLWFEAAINGPVGLFHLSEFLRRCGFAVPVAETPHDAADEEQTPAGRSDRALVLSITDRDGAELAECAGNSVRELFQDVFRVLLEHRWKTLFAALPIAMGRRRNLAATAPFHRDDKPFTAPLKVEREVDGVHDEIWVEVHLSREDALARITALCHDLELECVTPEEDELGPEAGSPEANLEDGDEAARPTGGVDDESIELACTLTDGSRVSGRTVREFFTNALDLAARSHWLERLALPYAVPTRSQRSSGRYLLAATPEHANGKPFRSPMPWAWSGGLLYVEVNFVRRLALELMAGFLGECERADAARMVAAAPVDGVSVAGVTPSMA